MSPSEPIDRRSFLQRAAFAGSLFAVGGLAACTSGDDTSGPTGAATGTSGATGPTSAPSRGGRLRIGMTSGGSSETLDPALFIALPDVARGLNLYERLVRLNADLQLEMDLAESIEPNDDATEWTFRLQDGVVFHDGSPLTADDLLFTIQRIAAPDSVSAGASSFRIFKLKDAKKLDDRTVTIPLARPFASVPVMFNDFFTVILKDGTTDFNQPNGTGPFVFGSFAPGESSLFTRNENYWREGEPYVDELEIRSIADETARLEGLNGGQLDASSSLTYALARQVDASANATVLAGVGPNTDPFVMATNAAPFDDVRVRQAMRLLVDREALVASVMGEYGEIGNDLHAKGLPFYAADIPQREHDPDQAVALLKAAGADGLTIPITTGNVVPGWVEAATIFAEQAKAAGVTVTVDQRPPDSYWSDAYMATPFFMTNWNPVPLPTWSGQALVPGGVWNETAWDQPGFEDKVTAAQSELDPTLAQEQWTDIQQILWDEGGYIVWGFHPWLDAVSNDLQGVEGDGFLPFGSFRFREWSLGAE
jgi:peptide/nickel transport system substrate-binding protein